MKRLIILTLAIGAFVADATAQDDLYFVPTKKNVEKSAAEYGIPADTYYAGCGRTADDYNRRRSTVQPIDSAGNDIIMFDGVKGVYPNSSTDDMDDYRYTRNMSRFDGYDWYEPYWAGYTDGRFDSWDSYNYWTWDYPYYGYRSWYWGYPYTYYSSWYWDRPWYGSGWHGHYRPYYGGYAYSRPNGVRRFSRSDFSGERTGGNSTASRRNFSGTVRDFSGRRGSVSNSDFSGRRNTNTYNNVSVNRQSPSFGGSSSFSGARGGGSFSGPRGGSAGGGSHGVTLGGRR